MKCWKHIHRNWETSNQPISWINDLFVKCICFSKVPSCTRLWSSHGCCMHIARNKCWFPGVCCTNVHCYSVTICYCFCINLVPLRIMMNHVILSTTTFSTLVYIECYDYILWIEWKCYILTGKVCISYWTPSGKNEGGLTVPPTRVCGRGRP